MRRLLIAIVLFFSFFHLSAQENQFFIDLSKKELATFNDGITLMKLLYNERDSSNVFIDNILWAAQKKLFQVTIPISTDAVNPVLTRRELAYWICKIFNVRGGIVNRKQVLRYSAYKICVDKGIIARGRGGYDSFTGAELLDTFSYLDFFIRNKKIKPRQGDLEIYDDKYQNLPLWRVNLYRELEEQRAREKELRRKKRELRKEKRQNKQNKTKIEKDNIQEKRIEKRIEEPADNDNTQ